MRLGDPANGPLDERLLRFAPAQDETWRQRGLRLLSAEANVCAELKKIFTRKVKAEDKVRARRSAQEMADRARAEVAAALEAGGQRHRSEHPEKKRARREARTEHTPEASAPKRRKREASPPPPFQATRSAAAVPPPPGGAAGWTADSVAEEEALASLLEEFAPTQEL